MVRQGFVLAAVLASFAVWAEPKLVGSVEGDVLQVRCGEKVSFDFLVVGTNGVKVAVTRYADDGKPGETATLTPDAGGRCRFESSTDVPGALMAYAKVVTADGKPVQVKSGRRTVDLAAAVGVVCDPKDVRQDPANKPADFDAFWDAERTALLALPICASNVVPTKTPGVSAVTLACLGGRPCTGYYTCPTNAAPKSCPALITLPGWNPGQRAMAPRTVPTNRIEFLISIHGTEMERDREYYNAFAQKMKGYAFGDKLTTPKDTSLYGIVMRTLKAIQFLKTRPEWNGELEVQGFSQGGFLTLMSAAMDPDVTKAVATCPWLCDFDRKEKGGMGGWTPRWTKTGSAYYLTGNFAPRIRCPVEMRGGLVDRTCSPAGLLAAWQCIPGEKTLSFYQRGGHGFKVEGVPEKDILHVGTGLPPHVVSGFRNMRDLGGWTGAGGRKVKRGLLFRSPAVSKAKKVVENGVTNQVHYLKSEQLKAYCVKELHIRTDLDLRFTAECAGMTGSPLGPTVEWRNIPVVPYKIHEKPNKDGSPLAHKRALDTVFDASRQPVLIHCAIGADRTGCVCALTLGILGVSEADIRRDYTTTPWLAKGSKKFEGFVSRLREKYPAETLSESMVKYAKFLGYTDADIAAIRSRMLE